MSNVEQKLTSLAAEAAAAHGLTLVCARLVGGRHLTAQILLEQPDGTSPLLDTCAKVSKALAVQLDALDLIKGRYTLEVTSPGLDRPLLNAKDYQRFTGRNAHIAFKVPQQVGNQALGAVTGIILAASDTDVTLRAEGTETKVAYTTIRTAELAPSKEELAELMKQANQKSKQVN